MSNVIISHQDYTLGATISGGIWQGALPLSNIQNPLLSKKSRSTNVATVEFYVDLGSAKAIRIISLCAHNLSPTGILRIRGYSDATYTTQVFGAGFDASVWPAGFTATQVQQYPKNYTLVLPSVLTARWWYFNLMDASNPDGYMEMGRLWLGSADFEPATGISYGLKLGYESRDIIEESLGGVPWGSKKTPRRVLSGEFNTLTITEKRQALIQQKKLTTTEEAFWISDSAATADDMLLEAFPCFIRQPSPLSYPYYTNYNMAIEVVERV
jgi:hypothetical protein